MKKRIILTLSLLVSMMVLLSHAYYKEPKRLENEVETEIGANESIVNAKIGSTDEETLYNYINCVPENIITLLQNNGWGYVIYSEDQMKELGETYGYKQKIIGLSVYDSHLIYVSNMRIDTVIHEIWHAVDSILEFPSQSDEALSIFSEEKKTFLKTFPNVTYDNSSNPTEYYAEAFQEYVLDKGSLKEQCPKTYELIEESVKKCTNLVKPN